MLQGCGTKGRAPYRNVVTHGFTLDEKGMKMSKSIGNTVVPQEVIDQYGADILRLWVALSDYTVDQRIGPEILKGTADSYRRLRNTLRYMLGALSGWDGVAVERDQMPELEQLMLHRLAELDGLVKQSYAAFDFQGVFQALFTFATSDLSAFYFDIRKDALYCDPLDSPVRRACLTVMDALFHRLTTWLAPIPAPSPWKTCGSHASRARIRACICTTSRRRRQAGSTPIWRRARPRSGRCGGW
jgi:Isoleucyl-tRNA synthetase (EC 6.1.1.5)